MLPITIRISTRVTHGGVNASVGFSIVRNAYCLKLFYNNKGKMY